MCILYVMLFLDDLFSILNIILIHLLDDVFGNFYLYNQLLPHHHNDWSIAIKVKSKTSTSFSHILLCRWCVRPCMCIIWSGHIMIKTVTYVQTYSYFCQFLFGIEWNEKLIILLFVPVAYTWMCLFQLDETLLHGQSKWKDSCSEVGLQQSFNCMSVHSFTAFCQGML